MTQPGFAVPKGPHPIFERMRLDAEGPVNASSFHHAEFATALERLALRADVRRVLLQSGAGLAAVVRWNARSSSPQFVLELIDQVIAVARTLDQR